MIFITALLFASSTLASHVRRQAALGDDIANIVSAVEAVTAATDAYTGGVEGALPIQDAAADVLTAIAAAQSTVDGVEAIENTVALSLVSPIQDLGDAVGDTVDALIRQESALNSAGLRGTVLSTLEEQLSAATTLSESITAKVSESLQSTAEELAQPILDNLARGIEAFSGDAPGNGGTTTTATPDPTFEPTTTEATATETDLVPTEDPTATDDVSQPTITTTDSPTEPTVSIYPPVTTPSLGPNATLSEATPSKTYEPVQYTGAAIKHAAGFGALALGALVAVM